jgi:hypothetical protein
MNNSRKYAEDLVGALKTEHYDTQRNVANQVNKTNWEKLANEYKNLQENLEMKRQANNRAFAKGLVNVAESSYDQSRAGAQNLAQRGLNVSGMQNLVQQADTAAKGERVLGLLNNLGENVTANMEKLSDATSKVAQKEAQLGADLADTLGDIGAAQTNAQMNYNAGLAEIAGSKDARDMENEMAKLQREAQAAANARSRSGNDGVNAEQEDFYKRQSALAILNGIDPVTGDEIAWDDNQKASALKILLGMSNAKDVVNAYNSNLDLEATNKLRTENYDKAVSDYEKQIQKLMKGTTFTSVNGRKPKDIFYASDANKIREALNEEDYDGIIDAVLGEGDNKYDLSRSYQTKLKGQMTSKDWDKLIDAANEYRRLKTKGVTLKDYNNLDMLFYE